MANSSINKGKKKSSTPGNRTDVGAESVVRFLHEELETKPQELRDDIPQTHTSLASRVRAAFLQLKK